MALSLNGTYSILACGSRKHCYVFTRSLVVKLQGWYLLDIGEYYIIRSDIRKRSLHSNISSRYVVKNMPEVL